MNRRCAPLRGNYPAAVGEFDAIRLNSDTQIIPASSREVLF